MVNEMVSVEVVDVLMSGGVVKGAWWIRILPSASCFFRSANSSAVRTEEAGGGDAEAGNLFGLSALPNSLLEFHDCNTLQMESIFSLSFC
jgi:hypothetical protein